MLNLSSDLTTLADLASCTIFSGGLEFLQLKLTLPRDLSNIVLFLRVSFDYLDIPSSLIYNIGKVGFLWIISLVVYVIAFIVDKYSKKQIKGFRKIRDSGSEYLFNLFLTTCTEIGIAILLNLRDVSFDTAGVGISFILAILGAPLLYLSPITVFYFQGRTKLNIRDSFVLNDTHFFFKGLKINHLWTRHYWVVYLTRRLLFTIFLVLIPAPANLILLLLLIFMVRLRIC